jgi:hypothetical protein
VEGGGHAAQGRGGHRIECSVDAVRELHGTIDGLKERIRVLAVADSADPPVSRTPWVAFAQWFVAGVAVTSLVAWTLVKKQKRPSRLDTNEVERWVNEEARLIPTERGTS